MEDIYKKRLGHKGNTSPAFAADIQHELIHDQKGSQYLVNSDYVRQQREQREPSEDKKIELQIAGELLNTNLRQLTEKQRDVMRYSMRGLTREEMSAKMGVGVSAIDKHLEAARKKLSKLITNTKEIIKEIQNGGENKSGDTNRIQEIPES